MSEPQFNEHGAEFLGDEPAVFIDVYSPATTWILDVFAQGRRVERKSGKLE
ncbi:MAG: hypothetical protein OXB99_08870 [Acidimicrobiaceae bacterium]|nr:hypothetical protein [Acidimicrobiaceae bacterium]